MDLCVGVTAREITDRKLRAMAGDETRQGVILHQSHLTEEETEAERTEEVVSNQQR